MKRKLKDFLGGLDKEKYEAIVGLDSGDALLRAFPDTMTSHPGLDVRMLDKSEWQPQWTRLLGEKSAPCSRVAYIHVPFCKSKCIYCSFFQNFCNDEKETLYIDDLLEEMKMSVSPYMSSVPLQAIYIGGGSPSSISPFNCARLLKGVREYLPLANDCEITYESRVNDMTGEMMETLFSNGVNRISLGVQTFDTNLRRTMGRIDAREEVLACLEALSSFGQAAIVIDLIYGFPSQTMEMWQNDLRLLKEAKIDGFDLYHLRLRPGSTLQGIIDNGGLPPAATSAEKALMFAEAEEALAQYSRLSVCHWAKNHRERSLYNTLCKSGAEVAPFGCGAGGNLGGLSLFMQRDIQVYSKQIEAGQKPLMFMGARNGLNKLAKFIAGQVDGGCLDLEQLGNFGEEFLEIEELLAKWEKAGLVRKERNVFYLERPGRFWEANIAQSLIECLIAISGEAAGAPHHRMSQRKAAS